MMPDSDAHGAVVQCDTRPSGEYGMVVVAYAAPVTPAAVLHASTTRSVLHLPTDIHSC